MKLDFLAPRAAPEGVEEPVGRGVEEALLLLLLVCWFGELEMSWRNCELFILGCWWGAPGFEVVRVPVGERGWCGAKDGEGRGGHGKVCGRTRQCCHVGFGM